MAQLSPPFRIALVAVLAVCALWFTVLKPKTPADDAPLPTAPGATGLANDVNAAKGAAAAIDAANAKVQNATGGATVTTPAKDAAAKRSTTTRTSPAKAAPTGRHAAVAGTHAKPAVTADRTAPLLRALDARKAVVLVFYSRKGIGDRAVRDAVAATNRHHGRVVVAAVPVSQLGRYDAITRGVQILQAPTVLVIAPDRTARAIAGFTTTPELDQAIGDALASARPKK